MKKIMALALVFILIATICYSDENYNEIKEGMTKDKVIEILGKPDDSFIVYTTIEGEKLSMEHLFYYECHNCYVVQIEDGTVNNLIPSIEILELTINTMFDITTFLQGLE